MIAQGVWILWGSKIAISHWQSQSPLTQGWRYRAARDKTDVKWNLSDVLRKHQSTVSKLRCFRVSVCLSMWPSRTCRSGSQLSWWNSTLYHVLIVVWCRESRPPRAKSLFTSLLLLLQPAATRSHAEISLWNRPKIIRASYCRHHHAFSNLHRDKLAFRGSLKFFSVVIWKRLRHSSA